MAKTMRSWAPASTIATGVLCSTVFVMPSAGGPVREVLGGQQEAFFSLC